MLEYGGRHTLREHVKKLSMNELRAVLFQLVFALALAQQSFQFVHGDLHFDNVLLLPTERVLRYQMPGTNDVFFVERWVVKIIDFGKSRVTLRDGSVLFNEHTHDRDRFNPARDANSLWGGLAGLKPLRDANLTEAEYTTARAQLSNVRSRLGKDPLPDRFFVDLLRHPFAALASTRAETAAWLLATLPP